MTQPSLCQQPLQEGSQLRGQNRPRRQRLFRWLHIAALSIAIPVGLLSGLEGAGAIVALFVVLVPLEKLFRRHDQPIRRTGLRTDLTYALVAPLLNLLGIAVGIGVALLALPVILPSLALRPLVTAQPGWLLAVEAVLLLDILIYWAHRLGHEIPFLWRFHSIHHSSQRMDWISGIRQHPFDGLIIVVPAVFLVVAGFDLQVVGIVAFVQAVLGLVAHANIRWRLRPLHRIVMTPEFHHWHHANYPESIHTNYSVFLPVWDLIWGTYFMPSQRRPEVYGCDEAIPPSVPGQLIHPFRSDTRKQHAPPWRRNIGRVGRRLTLRRPKAVVS